MSKTIRKLLTKKIQHQEAFIFKRCGCKLNLVQAETFYHWETMANQVLKVENILMSTEIRCKHYYNELEQCGQHFLKCLYKKHSRLVCLGVTLNMPPSSVNKIIICRKLLFLASPSEIELSNTFYITL